MVKQLMFSRSEKSGGGRERESCDQEGAGCKAAESGAPRSCLDDGPDSGGGCGELRAFIMRQENSRN